MASLDSEIVVTEADIKEKRLDKLLIKYFPDFSRSFIKKKFEEGLIIANIPLELKKTPPPGTVIQLNFQAPSCPEEILPENIPLDILFEDESILVINKSAGMVVHPAPGNMSGTLVNALLHHYPQMINMPNKTRPGIVHRLDKGTSGVMVVAKSEESYHEFVKIFKNHKILREYEALVIGGKIPFKGVIETTIARNPYHRKKMKANVKGGKNAITHYFLQAEYEGYSHLKLRLETGRTHQIRVHLSQVLGRPILGDEVYGNRSQQIKNLPESLSQILKSYPYPMLHASILGFRHPTTGQDMTFSKEVSSPFTHFI